MRHPDQLKELLKSNGIPQATVAEILGLSTPTICQALMGNKPHILERINELVTNNFIEENRAIVGNKKWALCTDIDTKVREIDEMMEAWLGKLNFNGYADLHTYTEAVRQSTQYICYNYYGLLHGFSSPLKVIENSLQLDHRFSIRAGFKNKINPIALSIPHNLQYVSPEANQSKGDKCDIGIGELLLNYDILRKKYPRAIVVGARPILKTALISPMSQEEALLKKSHYACPGYRNLVNKNSIKIVFALDGTASSVE